MINNNRTMTQPIEAVEMQQRTDFVFVIQDDKYEDCNAAFNYQNINRCYSYKKFLQYRNIYEAYNISAITGKYFIHLNRKVESRYERSEEENGFKFHISLECNKENVEKGWNVIMPLLIKHEVILSKVIVMTAVPLMAASRNQCGKEVTIYAYREKRPLAEWQELIEAITHELVKNKIKPGPLPPSDTEITGSNYFSYRNDASREDVNSEIEDAGSNQIDPFAEFEQVVDNADSDSDKSSNINNVPIDLFSEIKINIADQLSRPLFFKNNVALNLQAQQEPTDEKKNQSAIPSSSVAKNDPILHSPSLFQPKIEPKIEAKKKELKKCNCCAIQ